MAIKFNKFNVTDGTDKARVWYNLDNRYDGRKSVNISDKDYGHALSRVFAEIDVNYRNETDTMTDYFDKGRATIFEDHPLYVQARAHVEALEAARGAA
jgi:hypothetical protein